MDAIVFLNRPAYKSGPPALFPISRKDAWKRLCFSVWAVQIPAFDERLIALERLIAVPTYEIAIQSSIQRSTCWSAWSKNNIWIEKGHRIAIGS